MLPRTRGFALLGLCLLPPALAGAVVLQAREPSREFISGGTPARSAMLTNAPAGQINIRNGKFNLLRVEIRLGPSTDCDKNPAIEPRVLKRGQAWAVVANETLCWRAELTPGAADGRWTPWVQRAIRTGVVEDVEL